MENGVTKISDLPMGGSGGGGNSMQIGQPDSLPTISISEMKKKSESDIQTNYTPMNVHPNPYGMPQQNQVMQNPENQRLNNDNINKENFQTVGLPDEFRDQVMNTPVQRLPSRDIPVNPDVYNLDENVQPNYVPKNEAKNDYVREHHDMTEKNLREYEQQKYRENKLDDILEDLQMPIFVALLFFLFQLPVVNTMIFKKFSFLSIYGEDGNFNFYGLLLKSMLFGSFYMFSNKFVNFISTL
jgi:hypothetical protein